MLYNPKFTIPAAILTLMACATAWFSSLTTSFLPTGQPILPALSIFAAFFNVILVCKNDYACTVCGSIACFALAALQIEEAIQLDESHLSHCMDHPDGNDSPLCETQIYVLTNSIGATCWIIAGFLVGLAMCLFPDDNGGDYNIPAQVQRRRKKRLMHPIQL